jgi:hypothetical protein
LPSPSFSFILPPTIPGIVSTGLIFSFRYMCTQYLQFIHTSMPFPHLLPYPMVPKICHSFLLFCFLFLSMLLY